MKIQRALISVWDKTGLVEFANFLVGRKIEIYTTGGTGKALSQAGIPFVPLDTLTGFTELLDGRVKTLHPNIFAGILARRDVPGHIVALEKNGIPAFDIVAVNLYPFKDTLRKTNELNELLEMIDIGGVALIRAAAKNFPSVAVVCEPADYRKLVEEISEKKEVTFETRKYLAAKAFRHTTNYDGIISRALGGESFEEKYPLPLELVSELRYGENPHQKAALYRDSVFNIGLPSARQLWGKELSYNNILDLDAVFSALLEFADFNSCVIVKHLSPCGIARGVDCVSAYEGAFAGDPVSAFGGIVGFTNKVDLRVAEILSEHFYECVVAPDYEESAVEFLKKKKNLRIMKVPVERPKGTQFFVRGIYGGALVQSYDPPGLEPAKWETVTVRKPTEFENSALRFAWKGVKVVKSNAVIISGENAVFGIGGGLPSRLDSANLAVAKAGARAKGAVAASDAFFPFPDAMEALIKAGVTAVAHPGGSVRDNEVTEKANALGVAMVHTGTRHFRH